METKEFLFCAEIKAANEQEEGEGVFEGYASTFGNIDGHNDIVEAGAFAKSLKKREPKVLWQHDMYRPVGKLIDAREDSKGLWVKVKLALGTSLGRDAYELLKAGIIDSLSIGFRCKLHEYDSANDIRKIKEVDLYEFSLVTIPANELATITAIKSETMTERNFEKFLCDNGFSRKEAMIIIAEGYKGYLKKRDALKDIPDDNLRDADEAVKTLSKISNILKGNLQNDY